MLVVEGTVKLMVGMDWASGIWLGLMVDGLRRGVRTSSGDELAGGDVVGADCHAQDLGGVSRAEG